MSQRVKTLKKQLAQPLPNYIFSDEVKAAIASGPSGLHRIVALESTIISHGMPYPQNVECARSLEKIVRDAGAVPATIAILDGRIHVGLSDEQLVLLGKIGRKCAKVSRRDLPYIVAAKKNGATTVSGTILIANTVGIRVMATGGIGGVHRHGEVTMDVSADLVELGRTPMLVVCAGVKSILDIPRTLEYLETQGVGVAAFQTAEFPAFFTRRSGVPAPLSIQSEAEAAAVVQQLIQLRFTSGYILGVPLPKDKEAEGETIEAAIRQSLEEVQSKSIAGRDVTPYVLQRVNELTKGKSLESNIALVQHNTGIAARIAVLVSLATASSK